MLGALVIRCDMVTSSPSSIAAALWLRPGNCLTLVQTLASTGPVPFEESQGEEWTAAGGGGGVEEFKGGAAFVTAFRRRSRKMSARTGFYSFEIQLI